MWKANPGEGIQLRAALTALAIYLAATCLVACVVKDGPYQELARRYRIALPPCGLTSAPRLSDDWSVIRRVSSGVTARITAPGLNGDVLIQYSDEREPRRVSARRDYSRVQGIRLGRTVLYAHVSYTLLWTEDRLFEYDLASRRLLEDRRVAAADIAVPEATPCAQ